MGMCDMTHVKYFEVENYDQKEKKKPNQKLLYCFFASTAAEGVKSI